MRRILILLVLIFMGCDRGSEFVQQVPPPIVPPPPPPLPEPLFYSQVHQLKLSTSEDGVSNVDILWIIDNSGSMEEEQNAVILNTNAFIDNFTSKTNLRWKMGLISTDTSGRPYVGFENPLDWQTQNPVATFQAAVGQLGTNGSTTERMFEPVLKHLGNYPNFLRKDAYLALIILTDEDEQSWIRPPEFIKEISNYKEGNSAKILVYGVFALSGICPQSEGGFSFQSSKYKQLLDITNSEQFSLCDPDFGSLLSDLGKDLVSKITSVNTTIPLDKYPHVDTLRVFYRGQELKAGFPEDGGFWIYEPKYNVIKFTNPGIVTPDDLNVRIEFRPYKIVD